MITRMRSLCCLLVASLPMLAAARTADHYPVANGIGTAAIRLVDGRIDSFRPAPYAALDEGLPTPELAFDAYFGVRTFNAGAIATSAWLTSTAVDEVRAVDDANAVVLVQRPSVGPGRALRVDTSIIAPYSLERAAVLVVVTATNEGASAIDVAFPSIANFRIGGGAEGNAAESASFDAARDTILESGARGTLAVKALATSANHTMTPSDPFPLVRDGLALPTVDASGVRDNVVHGFTFTPSGAASGTLAPGASMTFGVLIAFASQTSVSAGAALASALHTWVAGRGARQLFDDEVSLARAHVASATPPLGMSADERRLWGSSLAMLRAAQVRDDALLPGGTGELRRRPRGQIVASLPPGIWNITWVRDAAYAIEGLLAAGKHAEAEAALQFFLDGDAGEYADYVGRDYLLSVTRSYGGGREESDFNAGGPNVEWDNFGLFLRAFARALDEGALATLTLDADIDTVKSGVADVLLSLVDDDGLLAPDSSIWESHWEATFESQGRRKYLYSSATAAAGLRAFGDALTARGDGDGALYRAAGDALASAIASELVETAGDNVGALSASLEEKNGASLDAAVIEALNRDVVDPQGATALATLAAMAGLRASTPGYFRNDEGGDYDSKEWLVVDMWLARAFRRAGDSAESERLLAHVVRTGNDNLGQIPELLAANDANDSEGHVDGATPMMGFGAGAYLSALADRANDLGLVGEGEGEPGEGEGEPGEGEGEGEGEPGEGEGEGEPGEGEGEGEPAEGEGEGEREGCAASTMPSAFAALALLTLLVRRQR